MLLKDNEENRNLQKELLRAAEDITSKTSKKKKGDRRLSDKVRQSLDSCEDWAEGSIIEDPDDREIQFNILRGEREVELSLVNFLLGAAILVQQASVF